MPRGRRSGSRSWRSRCVAWRDRTYRISVVRDRLRVRRGDALEGARWGTRRDLVPVDVALARLAQGNGLARWLDAGRRDPGEVGLALCAKQSPDQRRVVHLDVEGDLAGTPHVQGPDRIERRGSAEEEVGAQLGAEGGRESGAGACDVERL